MAKCMNIKAKIFHDFKDVKHIMEADKTIYDNKYSLFLRTYNKFTIKNSEYYELIKVKAYSNDKYN